MERIHLNFTEEFWRLKAKPELLAFVLETVSLFEDSKGLAIKSINDKESLDKVVEMGIFSLEKGRVKISSKNFISLGKKKTDESKENLLNKRLLDVSLSEIKNEELENYFKIAKSFQEMIYENLKKLRMPTKNVTEAKFDKWVNPIKLMLSVDGLSTDDLRQMFLFLRGHDFWSDKIQSTEKLRLKKETLIGQIRNNENRRQQPKKGSGGANLSPEYLSDLQRRTQGTN